MSNEEEVKKEEKKGIPDYVKDVITKLLVVIVCVIFIAMLIMVCTKTFLPSRERHYGDIFTQILN